MQTTILTILNVVIMMRMTFASFMQFGKLDKSMILSICHRGGKERGATTMTTEMVPRQHSGSGSLGRYRCKRKSDGSVSCKDGGVLPDTGFPHVGDKAKEGQHAPTVRTRGEQGCISYNMHSFVHGHRLGVIPSKRANGTVQVRRRK